MKQVERRELRRTAAAGAVGLVGGQVRGGPGVAGADVAHGRERSVLGRLRLVFLSHVNDPAVTPVFPAIRR